VTFRARVFLATALAALVPLTILTLGVRQEMERRLGKEALRRGEAAVQALGAELGRERERVAARLEALAEHLSTDNRFRLACRCNTRLSPARPVPLSQPTRCRNRWCFK
jgi:hypothetical protein